MSIRSIQSTVLACFFAFSAIFYTNPSFSQCTVNVNNAGSISASSTTGTPGANINFYSNAPASGTCGTCTVEYMWVVELNGSWLYSLTPASATFSYTFATAGNYKVYRCSRYVGCTSWDGESNQIYITISSSTCSPCPGNLVSNHSFENGTSGWGWGGGNLSAGGGGIHCGSYSGDFQITNASSNWANQEIFPSSYAQGGQLNISVYAGTHDNTYNNYVTADFFDVNWNWISGSSQQVDKILANSPAGPQLYTWTATIPANVGHITVGFGGNGSWTKTDDWCVTYTAPVVCNASITGLQFKDATAATSNTVSISNGGTYVLSNLPSNFNIEALTTGNHESIKFTLSGSATNTTVENAYTYDYPNSSTIWPHGVGTYTLLVQAYSQDNAAGTLCASQTFNFTITSCDNVTNAGSIGYDESFCGTSFDPSLIQSVSDPSGGTGALEYVWLMTTDPTFATYTTIPGSTSSTYDPGVITQTTWYRRCARRAGCSSYVGETNWIKKEIKPVPTANAGPTVTLTCTNTSATIGTVAVSGNSYSWSPTTALTSSTVAQPTVLVGSMTSSITYTLTVTNSYGCTATSTVIAERYKTPPTTDAGADKYLTCSTSSAIIGTTAISGYTYAWSPSTGLSSSTVAQPTANPASTTSYTVTVTNTANGCTASDVVVVNVNNTLPTADAGPDKTLTCTTSTTTIGTTSVSGYSYQWSPSTGLSSSTLSMPTVNISTTQSYTLTVTNSSNGCIATDIVTVYVNKTLPTANAGNDIALTCAVPSGTIGTASVSGYTYSWSPSAGLSSSTVAQPTASPSTTTTYVVTVTNTANGCVATDAVVVNVSSNLPTADAGIDKNINCNTSSTTIGTVAISGYTYSWSPATALSSTAVAQPTASSSITTTYTVTVTNNSNGCSAQDVVTVYVNKTSPPADAGIDAMLTCNVPTGIIGSTGVSGNTYSWLPTTGLSSSTVAQPTASPLSNTTYTLTVTNSSNGCTALDVVNVNVNKTPPVANAGNDATLTCSIPNAIIGSAAVSGYTYSWSPVTGLSSSTVAQPTASPTVTTTYTLTVTNSSNGCIATDVVTVNMNVALPTADAGIDKNLNCTTLSSTIGTAAVSGYLYSWAPSTGLSSSSIAQPIASPNSSVSYTLTVTNNSTGCIATDVVNVNVNKVPPTADAGVDKNLNCYTSSTVIGTASTSGYTYNWSPATGLNTTTIAQPTASPTTTTTYTLVVVNSANGCSSIDNIVVSVDKTLPTADAGIDKTISCGQSSTTIGTSSINGYTYSWSPATGLNSTTIAQPTASPSNSTSYTVTVTNTANGCTATDAVNVNVNSTLPTANAGVDKNITCTSSSTTIGTVAVSGYSYSWSPATALNSSTIAQPTAFPTSSTAYTLTVTNSANGCTAQDIVNVNVNTTPPIANAGQDLNLTCNVTSGVIGTAAVSGYTYSWSPSTGLSSSTIAMPTASPLVSTAYTLTVTNTANGCTANDFVNVNVNTLNPNADAGVDKTLSCSVTTTTIGSTAVSGYTYSWSPATGLSASNVAMPIATPSSTTSYTLTVTNSANGCNATDIVTVFVSTGLPTANAGVDKTITCISSSVTIGSSPVSGYSYSWNPTTGLNSSTIAQPTVAVSVSTSYTVTVTNLANGCTAQDVVNVNVNNTPPSVDAGVDKVLNCVTTSAVIGTTAISGYNYSWSPTVGLSSSTIAQPTASPNNTTIYTVTVINATTGCTDTDLIIVTVDNTPANANAGIDKSISCSNPTTIIGTSPISSYSYSWSPSAGLSSSVIAQPTAQPSSTTNYTLTVTNNISGCTATDVVTVFVNTVPPTADAGTDKTITCLITNVTIGTAATSGYSYNWSPASGLNSSTIAQPIANPTSSTIYTLTVTNSQGCTATDLVAVNVNTNTPIADAGNPVSLNCIVTSAVIGATPANGSPRTYSWSPSTGLSSSTIAQPTASPAVTTTYTLTVTRVDNGCSSSDVVTVSVNKNAPIADAGPDATITCSSPSAMIGTTGISGYTYNWSPAIGLNATNIAQPLANPSSSTSYTVTVTNVANGCVSTDVVNVNENKNAPIADAGVDKSLNCTTTSTTIGTVAISGNTYSWSPSAGLNSSSIAQPTASPSSSTSYTVTVTNSINGCIAQDVVNVNANATPPTVDAGIDKNLNCNTTNTIIGTSAIAGYTYSWSPSSGLSSTTVAQPTASPMVSTAYTLTVTNTANGCVASDVVNVNVNTIVPSADAGIDKSLNCNVNSTTIGTASVLGNVYSWNPAIGLSNANVAMPTATPSNTTTYTLTVTNAVSGCTSQDVVNVFVSTGLPTADAGVDKTITCNTSSVIIGTTAASGYSYSWSPSIGLNSSTIAQPIASPNSPTTYTLTVTNSINGCTAQDVVNVNFNVIAPLADAGIDKNLTCTVTSTTIGTASISGYSYSWSPSIGLNSTTIAQPIASPSNSTPYTVTVTNVSNGCTSQDVVEVYVNKMPPTADAGPDKMITCTTASVMLGSSNVSGYSYSWSPSIGLNSTTIANPISTVLNAVTYTVIVTNIANGCTATDFVMVDVNKPNPVITVTGNNEVCNGSTTIMTATTTAGTILWSTGATTNNVTLGAGIYTVTATNGTCSSTTLVAVNNVQGSIGNYVWNDLDYNGINNEAASAGLNGITVQLWSPGTDNIIGNSDDAIIATTLTANNGGNPGYYNFPICNSGSYYVKFPTNIGTNYVLTTTNQTAAIDNNSNADANGNSEIVVINVYGTGTSKDNNTIDAGYKYYTMILGNQVWYDTDNNGIKSTTEAGAVGVVVNLYADANGDNIPDGAPISSTLTDGSGLYSFNGLSQGTYMVGIILPSGYSNSFTNNLDPDNNVDNDNNGNILRGNEILSKPITLVAFNEPTGSGNTNATVDFGISTTPNLGLCYTGVGQILDRLTDTFTYTNNTNTTVDNSATVLGTERDINLSFSASSTSNTLIYGDYGTGGHIEVFSGAGIIPSLVLTYDGNDNSTTLNTTTGLGGINLGGTGSFNMNIIGTSTLNSSEFLTIKYKVYSGPTSYSEASQTISGTTVSNYLVAIPANLFTIGTGAVNPANFFSVTAVQVEFITNKAGISFAADKFNVPCSGTMGSIGNFVWNDVDANGTFNEPVSAGLNGVSVQLWSTGADNIVNTADDYLISNTTTANDINGNPGYYNFSIAYTGNYFVKFPTTLSGNYVLTASNQNAGVDNNSNADGRGNSEPVNIDVFGTGLAKNNPTIDAGYFVLSKLGNYVWNDINQDGLQNNNEVGVAGVNVSLYDANNNLVGSTITDAYGAYLFSDLYPGVYSVQLSLPTNYKATIQNSINNNLNSDINPNTLRTTTYTITPNQFDSSIDAGIFFTVPPPLTKIGDKVWYDLDKDGIQDPTEEGINGIPVTLKDANGNVVATTITDANGNYLFENVPVGNGYTITFTPLNQLVATTKDATNDADDSDIDPVTFTTPSFNITAGSTNLTLDAGFYLQDNTKGSIGDRVWFDANSNGIQDAGENGVGGIVVELREASTASIVATTTTDEQGNYIFNNLTTPNVYYVVFNIPGTYIVTTPNQGGNDEIDSDIPVTSPHQSSLIPLSRGESNLTVDAGVYTNGTASIGDRVWYDGNKNGIQDAGENGVAGVLVTLLDINGNPVDGNSSQIGIQPITTNTNLDGTYRFDNLQPGTYAMLFSNLPTGYSLTERDATGATVNSTAGDDTDSDVNPSTGKTASVTIVAGQYYDDLDAGIILGNSSGNGTIGDYVWNDLNNDGIQNQNESGMTGIIVSLNQDLNGDGDFNDAGETATVTTTTNSNGYYSFTDLVPGTYQVVFSNIPAGFVTAPINQGANDNNDSDGNPLSSGTSTTGIITLSRGQDDLSVDLGLYNPNVNSLGNYVWIDVNSNGIQDATEPGISGVMVTLLDANGNVYDANTTLAGTQPLVTTTNSNGQYMFNNLPDGTYAVKFSNLPVGFNYTTKDAGTNDAIDSDVDPITNTTGFVTLNSTNRVNTTLDAGLISVKAVLGDRVWNDKNSNGVQDAGEPGISGVTVTLYDATGNNPITSIITDALGNYLFTNLDPGTYVVGFSTLPNDMEFTTKDATSEALGTDSDVDPLTGKTSPITIVAGEVNTKIDAGVKSTSPASVGDYVWLDEDGDGIQDPNENGYPGIIVTLYDANNNPVGTTVTDGEGGYLFTNVAPGNGYYIVFSNLPEDVRFTSQTNGTTNGSDANPTTGTTLPFNLNPGEKNTSIDAGLIKMTIKLGNYVWNDINRDGIQDANEPGVSSVTVGLYDANTDALVSTTVTDAYGYYYFNDIVPGTYKVGFSLPVNYLFTTTNAGNDATDSDVDPTTYKTGNYILNWDDDNQTVDAGIYLNTGTTASLGNRVWNDKDSNGRQDIGEVGFAGVVVTLLDQSLNVVNTTITNGTGNYLFSNLTPGVYAVRFSLPPSYIFSPNNIGTDDDLDSDPNPTTGLTEFYTLLAGDNNMTVDAGVHLQQISSASIGNFVWNDLNNNGIQEPNEAGVPGVTVTLYANDGITVVRTTVTNGIGEYYFNGLTPGSYVVGFSNLPNGSVLSPKDAGTDDTKDSDVDPTTNKTSPILVLAGEVNTTIDAGINYPSNSTANLGNYVWFDYDRNGIQDAEDPGAAGITVELLDATNANNVVMTTVTDRLGFYMFNNIPAGTYNVRLSNLPAGHEMTLANSAGTTDEFDSDFNVLNNTTTSPYTIGLGQTILTVDGGLYYDETKFKNGSVGDFVWNDANNNGVQDADELGVPGVTVTLYAGDGTTIIRTTTTDGFGGYIFPNLPEGSYVVGFSNIPAGYTFSTPNQGVDDATDSDADPTNSNKTPVFFLPVNGINFTLDAGIHQTAGLASLGNFVWNDLNQNGLQDANEPGVPGVVVNLFDATNTQIASTSTDVNGIYQFTGLIPGMYSVQFTNIPANFFFTSQDANSNASDATDSDPNATTGRTTFVTLVSGQNYPDFDAGIFTLKAGLGNYVWLDANNNGLQDATEDGVPGVTVTLYNSSDVAITSTITDILGRYQFVNLDPGTYYVVFSSLPNGYGLTTGNTGTNDAIDNDADVNGRTPNYTLAAGDFNPTIDAGLIVTGTSSLGNYFWVDVNQNGIQDPTEIGLPGVTVRLTNCDGLTLQSTVTNNDGLYLFTNLTPGCYKVAFENIPIYYNSDGNPMVPYFTQVDAGADNTVDNDADNAGITGIINLPINTNNSTVDGGVFYSFVLPIDEFVATSVNLADNNIATINWYTENESNVKLYEVWRSVDGKLFDHYVGNTNSKGDNSGKTSYNNLVQDDLTDIINNAKEVFYKVKAVEHDGVSYYSNVVKLTIKKTTNNFVVFPSPFEDEISIKYDVIEGETIKVQLVDMTGRVVHNSLIQVDPSTTTVQLGNLSHLASGNYIVRITDVDVNRTTEIKVLKK